MKQVGESNRAVEISGVSETAKLTLHADARMFKNLLDSIYSEKEKTVVRELMANALDAHQMGGCPEREIEVHLPTAFNPTLVVRDYGVGMDHEFMMKLYSALGFSSKTGDNKQTGMFGVGSKSPLAISDSFTVKAFDEDGKVRTYVITVPSDDHPQISYVFSTPQVDGKAERGIEVTVPLDHKKRDAVLKGLSSQHFCWFDKPVKFLGAIDEIKHEFYTSITSVCDGLYVAVPSSGSHTYYAKRSGSDEWNVYVRQGAAVYPLSREQMRPVLSDKFVKAIRVLCFGGRHLLIDLPLGTANVTMAREAIQYDEASIANIAKAMRAKFDAFATILNNTIGDARDFHTAHDRLLKYFFTDPKEQIRLVSHKLAAEMLDLVEDQIFASYHLYHSLLPPIDEMEEIADVVTGYRTGKFKPTGKKVRPPVKLPRKSVELYKKDILDGKVLLHSGNVRNYSTIDVHISGDDSKIPFKIPTVIFVLPSHLREWKDRIKDYIKDHYSADALASSDSSFNIAVIRCAKRNVDDVKTALRDNGVYTPAIVMEELPNVGDQDIRKRNFSKTSVYPWVGGTWDEKKIEPDYTKPAYYIARIGIAHDVHLTHPTITSSAPSGMQRQTKASNYTLKSIYDDAVKMSLLDSSLPLYRVTENQAERIANTVPGWTHLPTHIFAKLEQKLRLNDKISLGKSQLGSCSGGFIHTLNNQFKSAHRHSDYNDGIKARLSLFTKMVDNDRLFERAAAVKWCVASSPKDYAEDYNHDRIFRALYTYGSQVNRTLTDKYDRLHLAYEARYVYATSFFQDRHDGWVEHLNWYLDKAWTVWEKETLKVNLDEYKELDSLVTKFRSELKAIVVAADSFTNATGDEVYDQPTASAKLRANLR